MVTPLPHAEGAGRARSATEAFLYRRLETLADTAGRFRLNAELPIAFDGWGRMEVDLLCEQSRIAIELDGSQHLGDAEAYRRDRRKDVLLQEHDYRVSASLLKTLGRISIKFWMQFCGPYLIKPLECELLPPVGTAQKHR